MQRAASLPTYLSLIWRVFRFHSSHWNGSRRRLRNESKHWASHLLEISSHFLITILIFSPQRHHVFHGIVLCRTVSVRMLGEWESILQQTESNRYSTSKGKITMENSDFQIFHLSEHETEKINLGEVSRWSELMEIFVLGKKKIGNSSNAGDVVRRSNQVTRSRTVPLRLNVGIGGWLKF